MFTRKQNLLNIEFSCHRLSDRKLTITLMGITLTAPTGLLAYLLTFQTPLFITFYIRLHVLVERALIYKIVFYFFHLQISVTGSVLYRFHLVEKPQKNESDLICNRRGSRQVVRRKKQEQAKPLLFQT
jgi:hypothetical protein